MAAIGVSRAPVGGGAFEERLNYTLKISGKNFELSLDLGPLKAPKADVAVRQSFSRSAHRKHR